MCSGNIGFLNSNSTSSQCPQKAFSGSFSQAGLRNSFLTHPVPDPITSSLPLAPPKTAPAKIHSSFYSLAAATLAPPFSVRGICCWLPFRLMVSVTFSPGRRVATVSSSSAEVRTGRLLILVITSVAANQPELLHCRVQPLPPVPRLRLPVSGPAPASSRGPE